MDSPSVAAGGISRSGRVVKRTSRFEDFDYGHEDEGLRQLKASAAAIGRAVRPVNQRFPKANDEEDGEELSDESENERPPRRRQPSFAHEQSLSEDEHYSRERQRSVGRSPALPVPVSALRVKRDSENFSESSSHSQPKKVSAYQLWCKEARADLLKRNPHLDIVQVTRILGQQWESLPSPEKSYWKMQAKKHNDAQGTPANAAQSKQGFRGRGRGRPKGALTGSSVSKKLGDAKSFDVHGNTFMEIAAHLNLLGQGLTSIGERLKEHHEEPVSAERLGGFASVLLDSALCSMSTLISLTQYVEGIEDAVSENTRANILDNISYIMPGVM